MSQLQARKVPSCDLEHVLSMLSQVDDVLEDRPEFVPLTQPVDPVEAAGQWGMRVSQCALLVLKS